MIRPGSEHPMDMLRRIIRCKEKRKDANKNNSCDSLKFNF